MPRGICPPKSVAVAPAPSETAQFNSVEPVVDPDRVSVISKTAPLPTSPSATEAWATLPETWGGTIVPTTALLAKPLIWLTV